MTQLAHKLIARTAREIAGEWYENAARDDKYYRKFLKPLFNNQSDFIIKCWGYFVPLARALLAKSLESKDLHESAKQEIFDALVADRSLPRRDNAPANLRIH